MAWVLDVDVFLKFGGSALEFIRWLWLWLMLSWDNVLVLCRRGEVDIELCWRGERCLGVEFQIGIRPFFSFVNLYLLFSKNLFQVVQLVALDLFQSGQVRLGQNNSVSRVHWL
jgi:hypothetical protein